MNTMVESIEYIEEIFGCIFRQNFLDVLNGLHPSIHFTMELSNDSIPFIGKLIAKNGNKLETPGLS